MFRSLLNWILYAIGLDPRGLFPVWDGRKWLYVDPIAVARELWAIPGFESDKSRELIASGIGTLMAQGYSEIANATRIAFSLRDPLHGGLSEMECDRLLLRFEQYLGDVKKNGVPKLTSAPYTGEIPVPPPIPKPSLDYGSTSTGNS